MNSFDAPSADSPKKTLARSRKALKELQKKLDRVENPRKGPSLRARILRALVLVFLILVMVPPFTLPVNGRVSSGYLFRFAPDSWWPRVEFHGGLDYAAPAGTPVRVTSPGIVTRTGYDPSGYGHWVRVIHIMGVESLYAHLAEVSVKAGDWILPSPLQRVGRVGATGRSTGNHLHFEIRWMGLRLPPQMFLVFHHIRRFLFGLWR